MDYHMKYFTGDATVPFQKNVIIAHCCNDIGAWGAGFVLPLAEKYPHSKKSYRIWANRGKVTDDLGRDVDFILGETQFCIVENGVVVANMIGQAGIMKTGNLPPIRYEALRSALTAVAKIAKEKGMAVQMPKIGAGLAGGEWSIIEKIISETLQDVETFILIPVFRKV
jgi:O-acetyl-ADP-ribose deacetylase (regulator of RNase III)